MPARLAAAAVSFLALVASTPAPAQSPPDAVVDLPAGVACTGFDLRIEIRGSGVQQNKTFMDRQGNPVRIISVGRGWQLSLINLNNGNSLVLRPNGSGAHTKFNPDGSQTVTLTGHNVLIMFPTDVPAGPSTTLYVGRVLYTVGTDGVFTIKQVSGTGTDICAAIA
jgi:hypothetical protein